MNTRPSRYRSTLIAAAVAIGCFGAAAAQAHDHGWHGHGEYRGGWHGHERGWYGAYGPTYGYVGPAWRDGWVGYAPPVAYYPPGPVAYGPGGVSVVVRLPF